MHLFLESGEGREKEKERNVDQSPLARAPTGDGTHNLGMCPYKESNRRPFGLWDNAQPTQPCGSGLKV